MAAVKSLKTTNAPGSAASSTSMSSIERGESANDGEELSKLKNGGGSAGKRNIAQLGAEKVEPYVRKRRCSASSSERSRKRTEQLNEEEQNILRLCINSRERKRMHELNDALDDLKRVIPCAESDERTGARKMSKINTIILATNWIRRLNNELSQLRANNEKLLLQLLAVKTNCQNSKEKAMGTRAERNDEEKTEDQPVTCAASTSSQQNALRPGADPHRKLPVGHVGIAPPLRIPSAESRSPLLPPIVPFTSQMLPSNAAFLMQGRPNQILSNAFAVQQLLAIKSTNEFGPENGGVDLFGHLPAALFPSNLQIHSPSTNQQRPSAAVRSEHLADPSAVSSNRKRKANGKKEEKPKKDLD
uniref:BHLH domain-containing protein n=1 Tax=Globodera rostochiensis TaxID=31243 RepID=A0A914I8T0_GLORO